MARTEKSMKALKSVKGLKSVKQIKRSSSKGLASTSLQALTPATLLKSVSSAKVKKSLPWVAAGVALGVGSYFAHRAIQKRGGYKAVAQNIKDRLPENFQTLPSLSTLTAWVTGEEVQDSQMEEASSSSNEYNKPYPVESTSKKHSKTRSQMRDTQKITQI